MATKKKAAPKKRVAAKKKSPAKKKIAAKKAPARKLVSKKKVAARKAVAKKSAPSKTPKKAPKKKTAVKKSAPKKASARRTSAKRPIKKKVATRSKVAISTSSVALLERPQPTFASTPTTEVKPSLTRDVFAAPQTEKKKSPVGAFLAFGAVVLIAAVVVTNSDSSTESAEPTPQASASQTASEDPAPSVELGAPIDVFADYTPTGGKVTWKAPTTADQVTGYLVQSSFRGSAFKTIATLEASVLSHEIMKIDTPGFTTFRVVAVYGDQEVVGNISDLKGQYEAQP